MKNKICISVIVPVYNVEKYLKQCLNSIITQTLKDIEIICVNDGSTDGGPAILQEYSLKDSRIKVINKENAGLGAARNTGFDNCSGEYVIFVDSDDFIEKSLCEKIYTIGKINSSDVIFFDVGLYWSLSEPITDFFEDNMYNNLTKLETFNVKDVPQIQDNHSVWSRAYSRDFLLRNNLRNPEQRFAEDMLFTYMTSVYAEKMNVINEKLYFYRQNRKGSLLEIEKSNDIYKLMYVSSIRDTKEFLLKTDYYSLLKENFLQTKVKWAVPRQINIQTKKDFYEFFNNLREIIGNDWEVLEEINFNNLNPDTSEYIKYLKNNSYRKFYLLTKLRRIFSKNYLFINFRIPKTMLILKIPRFHYFWKKENSWTRSDLQKMNEKTDKLIVLCNQIVELNVKLSEQNEILINELSRKSS
ncbi:MAG: glycosyltransferase family 2 protein [Anaerorhabdus sp.]|uniref:glycosyltransferase family 2 protein n=1 Tax=Anaerorhabdus sp. TaxID=1872524 RepID=UPI002FC73261